MPVRGSQKKIRLNCCVFGANSCILSHLFSLSILSILVSESIHFHLQSRELHRDRIHIPVNSLSLNADRSSHSFNQNGQSCETLDSCSCLLNFFDNPGQSLIQSAKYLLSWYRIGRYLQCPPLRVKREVPWQHYCVHSKNLDIIHSNEVNPALTLSLRLLSIP